MPALPKAVAAASRWGVDLSAHESREVRGVDLAAADLVLGFELSHISVAVVEGGARRDRTFTLPELVALLEHTRAPDLQDVVQRARARVSLAHEARTPRSADRIPEIRDPFNEGERQFGATAALLRDLSYRLAVSLFSPPTAT
jgi:protein-tyrosine-phosphatase